MTFQKRIEMNRFELLPGEHAGCSFAELLLKIRESGTPAEIFLQPGRYLFCKSDAVLCSQPVSNTLVYNGTMPHKHVGILLDGLSDLTIEGNGAEFIFDGDMSGIAMLNCRNIVLRDFSMDWLHPRVAEMRCTASREYEAYFELHPDSRAVIQSGKLFFLNPDGLPERAEKWIAQCAAADGESNKRSVFHPYAEAVECSEPAPGKFQFRYQEPQNIEVGSVWQFRNPVRNENGIFLHQCENVELDHLRLYFTPGLGVVAQLCRDLNIHDHIHAPKPGSGRVCAAFADCIQISSCRGKVRIAGSCLSGSQDDPVNIHGTYLGVQRVDGRKAALAFMQPETWGFLPFEPGDEVALVDAETLERVAFAHVRHAWLKDCRHVELELDAALNPEGKRYVIENLSACPEALIENNLFRCYPTRGVLISTSAPGIVRKNTFVQAPPRPAILISADAGSWYESGGIRDLLIEENRFENCSVPAISIHPANEDRFPLHRGIRIRNNTFIHCTTPYLYAQGCAEVETDLI